MREIEWKIQDEVENPILRQFFFKEKQNKKRKKENTCNDIYVCHIFVNFKYFNCLIRAYLFFNVKIKRKEKNNEKAVARGKNLQPQNILCTCMRTM